MTAKSFHPSDIEGAYNEFYRLLGMANPYLEKGNGSTYPKVNVVSLPTEIKIEAAVPGLAKSDIKIELDKAVLTISAPSNQKSEYSAAKFLVRELKRSAFTRSFTLGESLDTKGIQAECEDGILTITIPYKENDKGIGSKRLIEVK